MATDKKFHLSSTAQLLFEKVSLSFEVGKEEATISLVKPHNSSFLNGPKAATDAYKNS